MLGFFLALTLNSAQATLPIKEAISCKKMHIQARYKNPKKGRYQNLVWSDEFNGPKPQDDLSCYQRAPRCTLRVDWAMSGSCPDGDYSNVANLNKCTWSLFHDYSFWGGDKLMAYRASQVAVEDGRLMLTSAVNPDLVSYPGPTFPATDCGNYPNGELDFATNKCAFVSGGVDSHIQENFAGDGKTFHYGRVEMRARYEDGQGTYPALWMMPQIPQGQGTGWPYDGEIDLLEASAPDRGKVFQTYHNGIKSKNLHQMKGRSLKLSRGEWHTYAVEREEKELRFYVDDCLIRRIRHNELKCKGLKCNKMKLSTWPFYFILNFEVEAYTGTNWTPNPLNYSPQRMEIDYVRVYQ